MGGVTAEAMTLSGSMGMAMPAQVLGVTTKTHGFSTQELQREPLIQRLILEKVMTTSPSQQEHHRAPLPSKTLKSQLVMVMT